MIRFIRAASLPLALAVASLPSIAVHGAFAAPAKAAAKKAEDTKKQNAKVAATAGAQSLGSFGDWGAYTGGPANAKVCFVLSQPKERLPKGLNRDPAYIFISFRPAQGVKNEIAVTTGYGLKPGAEPVVTLGKAKFNMIAKDTNAFLRNAAEETQFVDLSKRTDIPDDQGHVAARQRHHGPLFALRLCAGARACREGMPVSEALRCAADSLLIYA